MGKYAEFRKKRMNSNPKHGPLHFRSPSKVLWRTIRGMVPHKTPRGAAALDRLRSFEGIPHPYDRKKRMGIPQALKVLRIRPERRFCRLGELSSHVGWKHDNLVQRLESQRKVKSAAYFAKRKTSNKAAAAAQKKAKVSKDDQQVLESAGFA